MCPYLIERGIEVGAVHYVFIPALPCVRKVFEVDIQRELFKDFLRHKTEFPECRGLCAITQILFPCKVSLQAHLYNALLFVNQCAV